MAGKKRKSGAAHAKAKKKNKKTVAAANAAHASEGEDEHSDAEMAVENDTETPSQVPLEDSLLSAELREELGGNDGDLVVLAGSRKKKSKESAGPAVTEEELQHVQKLSKSKRKKLEQLADRKRKEARREDLYKSLEQTQIPQKQLELMVTSSRLGHKETLRERLKRSMNREKQGLTLTVGEKEELYQLKDVQEEGGDESDDEMNAEEPVEEKKTAVEPTKPAKTKLAGATVKPATQQKTAEESQKKKKKQKARIATSIVPMAAVRPPSDSSTAQPPAPISEPHREAAVEAAGASASSSQSDAMSKLAALRYKNEERRRQRELAKANGSNLPPAEPVVVEEEVPPAQVYVPKIIELKTTREMHELSQRTKVSYKTTLVQLKRTPEIQLARMQLPVCGSEQEIMEAIMDNDVVLLCGETGSGKTTQVPQFLYEAGFGHPKHALHSGRIGVTQPRRVAAVSTAKRVAEELNVAFGNEVGYQIRYDAAHVTDGTRIKFMTDGILLKEIQQDFLLRQYSILLLDEAHERNVNTDILIGLLSRIAPLRAQMAREEREAYAALTEEERSQAPAPIRPLKLVIMSATLRVEDFTQNARLFPSPPPVLRVEARQYPVTVHFNKRTEMDDYVSEAYKKVVKIHRKLPEGGVLVFLTGQREITQLCRQLRRVYTEGGRKGRKRVIPQLRDSDNEPKPVSGSSADRVLREHDDLEEEADLEDARVYGQEEEAYALADSDDDKDKDSDEDSDEDEDEELAVPYLHVLPLYSLLPNDEQLRVFEAPPPGHRLVVVATNVAETSLTIPGIKYVVDAGRTKERVFDLASGISSFQIQWISKASADQRAGRAGRTGPGHCYRLYSSAVYDTEFAKFAPPEILCQPIEDLALQMKAMGIHRILQFPFPTPPATLAIQNALYTLSNLGAITTGEDEAITALGRMLVKFPVAARFAKMLLLAKQLRVLEYAIAIVAGLSGHTPFISPLDRREQEDPEEKAADKKEEEDEMEKEWREAEELRRHAQWVANDSDVLSLLRAAGAYAFAGASAQFCSENHLHEKTMQDMLQLRQQLTRLVNQTFDGEDDYEPITLAPTLSPPDAATQVVLRQLVAAGFLDHVARRAPAGTITEGSKIERNCAYLTASGGVNEPVYIHPHSHVFSPDPNKLPPFVVYQSIQRTSRAYMRTVTAVEPEWLAAVGKNTPLTSYSAPLAEPAPTYDPVADEILCFVKVHYGVHKWPLPVCKVAYPEPSSSTPTPSATDASVDGGDRYKWFAKFLLDGAVVSGFQPFASALKEPSYMLIRKKFDKKIQLLVAKLAKAKVSSRRALVATWTEGNKAFLRAELAAWYAPETQKKFLQAWKSIVTHAIAEEADEGSSDESSDED